MTSFHPFIKFALTKPATFLTILMGMMTSKCTLLKTFVHQLSQGGRDDSFGVTFSSHFSCHPLRSFSTVTPASSVKEHIYCPRHDAVLNGMLCIFENITASMRQRDISTCFMTLLAVLRGCCFTGTLTYSARIIYPLGVPCERSSPAVLFRCGLERPLEEFSTLRA